MSRLPSTTALRCLDASARLLSFTRAAEELHLTQGAVSHHILQLERQLGVPLFLRRKSGLELTQAGRKYWNDTSGILRQLERATESIITTGGRGGSLNLSVSSSFANYWLMPRLQSFVAANPDITLNLSTRVGPVDFASSDDDAAIEFCSGPLPGISAVLILRAELRPYVAPGLLAQFRQSKHIRSHALNLGQIADFLRAHTLIRRVTVLDAWPGWLSLTGLQDSVSDTHMNGGPRYALLSMALNGAIAGLGVALLPEFIAANAVESGKLVCLWDEPWVAPRAYYLRWPERRSELDVLKRFAHWVSQEAESNIANT
ncbi:LysR substrate-binding domain-containing protein [Cupriavidus pauculus]|uniref:LysR substrate-binding domain-containing protein n=1 Tax=Cupriavidus pauculus TaxID=82633 RepID=UPI0011AF1A9F|nr:LysR substrate-binding domain-containing protein [Cupriavidus pauculus]